MVNPDHQQRSGKSTHSQNFLRRLYAIAAGSFSGPVAVKTFGKAQYQWHPATLSADPDGPIVASTLNADPNTQVELPASSITVLRGYVKFSEPAHKH